MNQGIHPIVERIASGVGIPFNKVNSVLDLSSNGATVAFIARYRKEATGGLDEVDVRTILLERDRILDILDRQQTIIKAIEEQKKLTPELRTKILSTYNKLELEDIYAPYKKKKKTKADIARELGLDAFADTIMNQRIEEGEVLKFARAYLDPLKKLTDPEQVVEHTLNIVVEHIAHNVELKKQLRTHTFNHGSIYSKKAPRFKDEHSKFDTYFDYKEPIKNLTNPKNSHRVLAVQRGFNEKVLSIGVSTMPEPCIDIIKSIYVKNTKCIFAELILKAVETAYKDYLAPSIETDIFGELKELADKAAIKVFSNNVRDLLLQSPLGEKIILGMDPGFRTGCKLTVIGRCGELLEYATIYPVEPHNKVEESAAVVKDLCLKHNVEAISIGNGTASRETEKFVMDLLKKEGLSDKIICVIVNEAGASVYSASDVAREELPGIDITFRGAVSIARRLQDPLAELVKIDPKSIGVGQYQHDVDQKYLKESLEAVVEDCVNYVGVDLNTASPHLLAYVSGLGAGIARSMVEYRTSNGKFNNRKELLKVSKLGEKIFEQCAGFLRIRDGENPLDNTGVHPEKYEIIGAVCERASVPLTSVLGNKEEVLKLFNDPQVVGELGEYTVKDVIEELKKPGRDPRSIFKKVEFHEGINSIEDLKAGMIVNGVVSNITNFGVFVDIGVHVDGLVHISELSDKGPVRDPRDVVSLGSELKVKVMEVDTTKKQISLSLKQAVHQIKEETKERTKVKNDAYQKMFDEKIYDNTPRPKHQGSRPQQDRYQNSRPSNSRKEPPAPRVNPNSPFAKLMDIRNKVTKK